MRWRTKKQSKIIWIDLPREREAAGTVAVRLLRWRGRDERFFYRCLLFAELIEFSNREPPSLRLHRLRVLVQPVYLIIQFFDNSK